MSIPSDISCGNTGYNLSTASPVVQNATNFMWTSSGTGSFSDVNALMPVYTPSAADITGGAVILTLTAQANSPCTGTNSASLTLSINEPPTASAGGDITICEGSDALLNGSVGGSYQSINWTSTGTGTFY